METVQQQQLWPFSVASVVEDMIQENIGARPRDVDLVASRKAEEASLRRYEAAGWLRKTAGVVGGKDLPAEPSEEEFRLGLRSGIILCTVLNKVQPGAVTKVVEGPGDSVEVPDGAALSAFQYFENVRNFLVAVEEMGIPNFEASDLEQGGKSARVVSCILALKSYSEWKQSGGVGTWKYGGNLKPSSCGGGKPFMRKNSEPFTSSFSRMSSGDPSSSFDEQFHDLIEAGGASRSLNMLVRTVLSNRKQEEIPNIVESMLNKVMEEFDRRLVSHNEQMKIAAKDMEESSPGMPLSRTSSDTRMEEDSSTQIKTEECCSYEGTPHEEPRDQLLKQQVLVERQQKDIKELKLTLHCTKEGMHFLQMKYLEEFNNLGKHLHGLAHAASGYQRVLEENRKLYNQVQDLKGNIRVYCRVRPFLTGQPNRFGAVDRLDEGSITIITPSKYGKEGRKSFSFNKSENVLPSIQLTFLLLFLTPVANLKAALAMKEGESENSQHSRSSTPERLKRKPGLPFSYSWHSESSITNGHSQMEDGNAEARNHCSSLPRRRSLDPQDLILYSPTWSSAGSPALSGKEDDKESVSGDWVDKVMVNRLDAARRDENPAGQWEVDSRQLPGMFYQIHARDPSKIYPEQPYKSPPNTKDSQEYDAQRSRFEMASTDDSDELEAATSDSSEPDLLWQSNIPRMTSLPNPNVLGSKIKKTTNPRGFKSTGTSRSLIPSLIPSPSRKLPNGASPGLNKPGRQLVSADGKRKTGHAK
ncbi:hypothetical protein OIU76_003096 [Salix suchowensis]|nr:hypothetical protein OIU76_003096 [Salix suchowensis]